MEYRRLSTTTLATLRRPDRRPIRPLSNQQRKTESSTGRGATRRTVPGLATRIASLVSPLARHAGPAKSNAMHFCPHVRRVRSRAASALVATKCPMSPAGWCTNCSRRSRTWRAGLPLLRQAPRPMARHPSAAVRPQQTTMVWPAMQPRPVWPRLHAYSRLDLISTSVAVMGMEGCTWLIHRWTLAMNPLRPKAPHPQTTRPSHRPTTLFSRQAPSSKPYRPT